MNGLLLVDDNVFLTRVWSRILEMHGYRVSVAHSFVETEAYIASWADNACSYVLLDLKLPDGDGADLLPIFAALDPKPLVAVVTAHLDYERTMALYGQCVLCAPKPQDMEAVLHVAELLSRARRSKPRNEHALEAFSKKFGLDEREAALVTHLIAGPNVGPDEVLGCRLSTVQELWVRIFEKTGYQTQLDIVRAVRRLSAD